MNADRDPPRAGDCWSLQSRRNGPELPPSVLLIRRLELPDGWYALPLFMEAGMAGHLDVKLEPEPLFLNGESWCALSQGSELHEARLFGKLGVLEHSLFREVRNAVEGETCNLRRGMKMMTEGIDPRTEFHERLGEDLRFCGSATVRDAVSFTIRLVVSRSEDRITGILEDLQNGLTSILQPEQVLAPVYRGTSADQPEPARWKMKLPDSGKKITVECAPIGGGWHLMIQGDGIRAVSCSSKAHEDFSLTPLGTSWTSLSGDPLAPGAYTLRIDNSSIDLQLNSI